MPRDRSLPPRRFLGTRPEAVSLPWTDAARMLEQCTACGACVDACPQDILQIVGGTHPEVTFTDACTFCAACAEICPEDVFDIERDPPWDVVAQIGPGCLEHQGVSCRACEDSCEARALRARPQIGGTSVMALDTEACTGCGACVSVCPVDAVTLQRPQPQRTEDAA